MEGNGERWDLERLKEDPTQIHKAIEEVHRDK